MRASAQFLNAAEAARRLGVSAKALRLYEERGLILPVRSAAGWRAYGPGEMARAGEIASLRALGLSLAQVAQVLEGDARSLEPALAQHQAVLEERMREVSGLIGKVRDLRTGLARGRVPAAGALARLLAPEGRISVAFDLPWPWGGEQFELHDIRPLNFITGPLGCGKTRFAMRLAETVSGAVFLPMDRAQDGGAAARTALDADPGLQARVDQALSWLIEDGAEPSDALTVLLAGLEATGPAMLVVDMVEHGLDQATQAAVITHLRRRGAGARPLFLMTRSTAILDLAEMGADETIIFCPANHSPPMRVAPYPGAAGYEAVASCLASPDVRARTEGVVALYPQRA